MRSNDLYRERIDVTAETRKDGHAIARSVLENLEALRSAGNVFTESMVESALAEAGLDPSGTRVREDYGSILFGATFAPTSSSVAGCIHGSASLESITVEVGGLIADGGCLPAQ